MLPFLEISIKGSDFVKSSCNEVAGSSHVVYKKGLGFSVHLLRFSFIFVGTT